VLRFVKIGSRDHELLAPDIQCTLENVIEVILMSLGTMVFSSKDWISKVDADLLWLVGVVSFQEASRTDINVS
jgi:hypothetical protein